MRKSALPIIGFVLAALAGPAFGGPIYMKFEGVDGEATAAGHEKWIEIQSYQWAMPVPAAPAAPAPAGVASGGPGRLSLTKRYDKASPLLAKAAAAGQLVPAVQVDVPKGTAFLRYELKNVMVSSFSAGGGRRGDATPTESLSLNFSKIEFKYDEQKISPKVVAPYRASTVKR